MGEYLIGGGAEMPRCLWVLQLKLTGIQKPRVKVRVEIQQGNDRQRQLLGVIEMAQVPAVGELFGSGETTYEVVQTAHTPVVREYDALIVLRKRV